ncbi:hypothetical protein Z517_07006 [Fonsecaea pedrosoi CBS 271.37]|uniref:Unplaced genomic scaffold supercont1.4, whole genome shotgun sequence n=1 Tax=Fonsecaea pedrosoi CBS 271.37 TaxID=1442368 RepID=A0A0D2DR96_9EURO|nr:uncharacterized protein Z517_07006 [Fonsecaea pedrosoi CBS 271.37]KIW80391.1 hypothetical protein Z517_07006 [Fonsecaea pedrosoi CBS 271.37]
MQTRVHNRDTNWIDSDLRFAEKRRVYPEANNASPFKNDSKYVFSWKSPSFLLNQCPLSSLWLMSLPMEDHDPPTEPDPDPVGLITPLLFTWLRSNTDIACQDPPIGAADDTDSALGDVNLQPCQNRDGKLTYHSGR